MAKFYYVQFPLSLLQQIFFQSKETFRQMYQYGIAKYAIHNQKNSNLSSDLDNAPDKQSKAESIIRETIDDLSQSADEITISEIAERYITLVYEKGPKDKIWPMIKLDLLTEFIQNNKKLTDIESLIAFVAAKSIVGEKKYILTNYNHILARMFGFSSINRVTDEIKSSAHWQKLSKRYHRERIQKSLMQTWRMGIYSFAHQRGFYLSKDKLSDEVKSELDSPNIMRKKKQKTRILLPDKEKTISDFFLKAKLKTKFTTNSTTP